jgi:hypothetical protein
MAQEPSSKDLLEAVKQQESGGRRYKADGKTLLEGPMTKYGTAKGEMQVLDMTNKDPGFGVRPAKDDSADERARVGQDYLAAMVKRYGDRKTALVAYNWGPGNTDKWLKKGGDFSKLPSETRNYVAKITGALGETKLAQASAPAATVAAAAKPKPSIQRAVYKAAPLTHPMLSQLGPSFQAAMAVSMLADEGEKEGKTEDEPSEAEKMLTETAARPVALASADLSFQSPFPTLAPKSNAPAKQQLQSFKHGGVVHMQEGGDPQIMEDKATSLEGANVPVYRSAKELEAYTQAMNPAVKTRSDDLGFSTRGYITPSSPDTLNLNYRLTPAEREITTLHELEHSMDARGGDIYGRPNFALMGGMDNNYRAYSLMGDDWSPITETVKNMVDNREKLEKFFGRPVDNAYFRKDSYDELKKSGKTKAMFSEQLASLSALEQATGKFLTHDPEMRNLFPNYRMMAVYDALTGPRQTRMDPRDLPPHTPVPSYTYVQNPVMRGLTKALTGENEYGTSYRPFPIKRADGGEVAYFQDPMGAPSAPVTADTFAKGKEFRAADALKSLKEVGSGMLRSGKAIVQGVSETPYNLVGGVADIGNMVLTPLGLGSEEPALGSAHLKRLALERGVRQAPPTDPRDKGFYMMGELGASVVNPGPIAAKVGQATEKAVTTGGKAVAKEMLRGMEGKGVLAPVSPQESIMYAIKPTGGVFTGSRDAMQGSVEGPFIDDVSRLIRSGDLMPETRSDLQIPLQSRIALSDWTKVKIGNYIRRDMATEGDPFVKATDQGKKLHLHENIDEMPPMDVRHTREMEGYPKQGFAKTPLGKKVEDQIDSSIYAQSIGDVDTYNIHPSLVDLKDTDPTRRIYEPGTRLAERMQFPKLIEGMEDMLAQREYKAYGEFSSPIPEQYQLTPDKLKGLSPVQASEKVALFNQWRDTERQKQAAQYLDKYGNTYKKYDNGRKWIAMDDLAEEPRQAELVQQAGCLGGWCTKDESFAMENGTGDNRLHLLFDEKAVPRVQLTVTKTTPTVEDFVNSMEYYQINNFRNKYGDIAYMHDYQFYDTPEYQAWARMQDNSERITELKGQFNTRELAKDPNLSKYLKEVQDFVKSKPWGAVANLEGINMINLDESLPVLSRGLSPEQTNQLREFMKSLNDGSVYADKYEGENILREASLRLLRPLSPPGRAMGGMVERQPSTARYI